MLILIVLLGAGGTWAYCRYLAPRTYRSHVSLILDRPTDKKLVGLSDLLLARTKVILESDALREEWNSLREQLDTANSNTERSNLGRQIDAFLAKGEVAECVQVLLQADQSGLKDFRDSVELRTSGERAGMIETMALYVERPAERESEQSYLNAMYAADVLADMYVARFQMLQREPDDPAALSTNQDFMELAAQLQQKMNEYQQFIADNPEDINTLEQLLNGEAVQDDQTALVKARENEAALQIELAQDRTIYNVLKNALPPKSMESDGIAAMSDAEIKDALAETPTDLLKENIAVVEMSRHLAKLEVERTNLETHFTEASHEWRHISDEINRSRRQLLAGIVAQVRNLETNVGAREQQLAINRDLIERRMMEQNETNKKLVAYAGLKNEFEMARQELRRLRQVKLDAVSDRPKTLATVAISKLGHASMPDPNQPYSPKTGLYTIAAFLISLFLGVATSFYFDGFDHTLRSSADAERYLDLPVLGSVKRRGDTLVMPMNLGRSSTLTPVHPRSQRRTFAHQ